MGGKRIRKKNRGSGYNQSLSCAFMELLQWNTWHLELMCTKENVKKRNIYIYIYIYKISLVKMIIENIKQKILPMLYLCSSIYNLFHNKWTLQQNISFLFQMIMYLNFISMWKSILDFSEGNDCPQFLVCKLQWFTDVQNYLYGL
jgi:hypothetical protein